MQRCWYHLDFGCELSPETKAVKWAAGVADGKGATFLQYPPRHEEISIWLEKKEVHPFPVEIHFITFNVRVLWTLFILLCYCDSVHSLFPLLFFGLWCFFFINTSKGYCSCEDSFWVMICCVLKASWASPSNTPPPFYSYFLFKTRFSLGVLWQTHKQENHLYNTRKPRTVYVYPSLSSSF